MDTMDVNAMAEHIRMKEFCRNYGRNRLNRDIVKYGNTRGCVSRICCGQRPPDHGWCSTYSCHYSRDYKPGEAWKIYYLLQKRQQCGLTKHDPPLMLSRCGGTNCYQNVVKCLPEMACCEITFEKQPQKFAPDFYVRPWQQQFIPPLQEPPCPVHGFDRIPQNVCNYSGYFRAACRVPECACVCKPTCIDVIY